MEWLSFKSVAIGLGLVLLIGAGVVVLVGANRSDSRPVATGENSAIGRAESVDVEAFAESLKKPKTIIDVRTPEEFSAGHISGAVNLDFYASDFQAKIAELDINGEYAIYCRSGNRSGQALSLMRSLGFVNVLDLRGGVIAWEQKGQRLCSDLQC